MILRFNRAFRKHYRKLSPSIQIKVDNVLRLFRVSPYTPSLGNHELKGSMQGKRAISVTGDVRIIYRTTDKHITVLVIDVGTHDQVY